MPSNSKSLGHRFAAHAANVAVAHFRAPLRSHVLFQSDAADILVLQPEQLPEAAVGEDQPALDVVHNDGVVDVLHQPLVARFAFPQVPPAIARVVAASCCCVRSALLLLPQIVDQRQQRQVAGEYRRSRQRGKQRSAGGERPERSPPRRRPPGRPWPPLPRRSGSAPAEKSRSTPPAAPAPVPKTARRPDGERNRPAAGCRSPSPGSPRPETADRVRHHRMLHPRRRPADDRHPAAQQFFRSPAGQNVGRRHVGQPPPCAAESQSQRAPLFERNSLAVQAQSSRARVAGCELHRGDMPVQHSAPQATGSDSIGCPIRRSAGCAAICRRGPAPH